MFRGMKIYTVHIKPDEEHAAEKPVFVREGFNLFAFLFTGIWALYHRLWWLAALLIALQALLGVLAEEGVLAPPLMALLGLVVQLLVGLQGNDWVRARLTRSGYITADITIADSLLRAEQRYFERQLAHA